MTRTPLGRRLRRILFLLAPVMLISGTACVGLQAQGSASTAPVPGAAGASRLPQLLQQLQTGSAALEIIDGSPTATASTTQAQVLGIQGTPTPLPGTFSSGAATPSPTPKLTPTATATATATATPTRTAIPTTVPSPTPQPGH